MAQAVEMVQDSKRRDDRNISSMCDYTKTELKGRNNL